MTQTATENPLLEGLRVRRAAEPCALTIFGASGDLTRRKLLPALYSLAFRRLLPPQFAVLGVARTEPKRGAALHAARCFGTRADATAALLVATAGEAFAMASAVPTSQALNRMSGSRFL